MDTVPRSWCKEDKCQYYLRTTTQLSGLDWKLHFDESLRYGTFNTLNSERLTLAKTDNATTIDTLETAPPNYFILCSCTAANSSDELILHSDLSQATAVMSVSTIHNKVLQSKTPTSTGSPTKLDITLSSARALMESTSSTWPKDWGIIFGSLICRAGQWV